MSRNTLGVPPQSTSNVTATELTPPYTAGTPKL